MREFLYPLGYLASFLFGIRFYVQWYLTEKKKAAYSGPLFWYLSTLAHLILAIHAFIQFQFVVLLLQVLSGLLSLRNLELIRGIKRAIGKTLLYMGLAALSTLLLYLTQWRAQGFSWSGGEHFVPTSLNWHLFGLCGMSLFASRFWIQWWQSEKKEESHLSATFFWISLIGSLSSFIYFLRLWDLVNMLGYGFGMSLYVRNLMLMRKRKKA